MNKCLICQKYIYTSHGNSKYCDRHKPHKFTPVPRVHQVTMSIQEFNKIHEKLKRLEQIERLINENT